MIKKYNKIIKPTLLILFYVCVVSCQNKKNINNLETENDIINKINTNDKKVLKDEFISENSNNKDITLNDINNVSKLNGFKNVKLGSDLNNYSFENYSKNDAYLSDKYSRINNHFDNNEIIIGSGQVLNTKIEYIDNKLVNIELYHFEGLENSFDINIQDYVPDYRNHSLVNFYTKIFGKPTKAMLFDNDIYFNYPTKVCFQEDYESCFSEFCNLSSELKFMESIAISFIWETDSVIYELIILSSSLTRSGNKEIDKKKDSYDKGEPYYSSERSIIRIYKNDQNLFEKLKSLEKESFKLENEEENNAKAKNNLKGI
jgi:hypothetical protein